jgi:hypothetical protein
MEQTTPKYVAIRYIGSKPKKADNVLHRNIEWVGKGDVQFVPIEDAVTYVRYKDIWEYARDVEKPSDGTPFPEPLAAPAFTGAALEAAQTLEIKPEDTAPTDRFEAAEMADRVQECIRAIAKLTKADFSENGKPKTTALARVIGRQVYAEERDAAWDHLTAVLREDQAPVAPAAG